VACRPLADQLAGLETEERGARQQLAGLTGEAMWRGLAAIGTLRLHLLSVRSQFEACVAAHHETLAGSLLVVDTTSDTVPGTSRIATLWALADSKTTVAATTPVTDGRFGFDGPIPDKLAVTVTAGDAVEVRSGALSGDIPDVRLEVVIGPVLTIPHDQIQRWLPTTFEFPDTELSGPNIAIAVAGVHGSLALGADTLQVSLTGTIKIAAPIAAAGTITVLGAIGLTPRRTPDGDQVDVHVRGDTHIQVNGLPSALADLAADLVRPYAENQAQTLLSAALHDSLPRLAANFFALDTLPDGVNLALRHLSIDADGITIQPAISCSGTVLSTFPAPTLPDP
jgi:hypothetical protein